jgi:dihydropteroate synthase
MIKNIFGPNEDDIIQASAILAAVAVKNGANIIRVHDVDETKKAIQFLN